MSVLLVVLKHLIPALLEIQQDLKRVAVMAEQGKQRLNPGGIRFHQSTLRVPEEDQEVVTEEAPVAPQTRLCRALRKAAEAEGYRLSRSMHWTKPDPDNDWATFSTISFLVLSSAEQTGDPTPEDAAAG